MNARHPRATLLPTLLCILGGIAVICGPLAWRWIS